MVTEPSVADIAEAIVRRFEAVNGARDRALGEGRQIVRLSANGVRAVHRGDFDEAARLMDEVRDRLVALTQVLASHPNLYWAGYVQDAMKEYAEARVTLAAVRGEVIPGPEALGIEDAPYVNALAEAASELRRDALDALRGGDLARAEGLLGTMDEIYGVLVTIDFPDAITGGLRRTTDALRAVLERTRGDLTLTLTQQRLERALREVQADLQRGR